MLTTPCSVAILNSSKLEPSMKNQAFFRLLTRCICSTFSSASILLLAAGWFTVLPANSQGFNNRFPEANQYRHINGKGKTILAQHCNTVTVNTLQDGNGQLDFHLSFIDGVGNIGNSFNFGTLGGNEFCNALCESQVTNNAFLLCGQSANGQMLVMKASGSGSIFWSKEINFGGIVSEAVAILPITNQLTKSYMVVGNNGDEVAVAKIDDNGNVLWAKEYLMQGSAHIANIVSDAIISKESNEKYCVITGTQTRQNSSIYGFEFGVFVMQIKTNFTGGSGWDQTVYFSSAPNTNFHNPQIEDARPFVQDDPEDSQVVISYEISPFSQPQNIKPRKIGLLRTRLFDLQSPIWAYQYESPAMVFEHSNRDLIQLGNNSYSLLITEHTNQGEFFATTLRMTTNGAHLGAYSGNRSEREYAGSMVESCVPGVERIHASYFQSPIASAGELRVIHRGQQPIACGTRLRWDQLGSPVSPERMLLNIGNQGTATHSPVSSTLTHMGEVYDCNGDAVQFRKSKRTAVSDPRSIVANEPWFYPNPVKDQLHIHLEDEPSTVRLYSPLGQLVWEQKMHSSTTIDLSEFSPGAYFLSHSTASGTSLPQKLVIQ